MTATHLPTINKIGLMAPFSWLAAGWSDFCRALVPCLIYGLSLTALSLAFAAGLFMLGAIPWIIILCAGFTLIAPMLAMGLYEAGRKLELGEKPSVQDMFFVRSAFRRDLVFLGLALVLIYSVWVEIAFVVYGLSTNAVHRTLEEFLNFLLHDEDGLSMAMTGTAIGGLIAFVAYALVVVSAPMLLNEKTDVFMATITSVRSVAMNFFPMLVWAALIVLTTFAGLATGFLGLVVVFPVIGLASWRAYRDLVPSSGGDLQQSSSVDLA